MFTEQYFYNWNFTYKEIYNVDLMTQQTFGAHEKVCVYTRQYFPRKQCFEVRSRAHIDLGI